jgi:hypothetical protein
MLIDLLIWNNKWLVAAVVYIIIVIVSCGVAAE